VHHVPVTGQQPELVGELGDRVGDRVFLLGSAGLILVAGRIGRRLSLAGPSGAVVTGAVLGEDGGAAVISGGSGAGLAVRDGLAGRDGLAVRSGLAGRRIADVQFGLGHSNSFSPLFLAGAAGLFLAGSAGTLFLAAQARYSRANHPSPGPYRRAGVVMLPLAAARPLVSRPELSRRQRTPAW
jgi:hypothetical protein